MERTDLELLIALKNIFDRYIADQAQPKPIHKIKSLPSEIHGPLADLMYRDGVKNSTLVSFIVMLLYAVQDRRDKEILVLVKDIDGALNSLIENATKD